ncbi:hypothetical protein PAMC26577_02795 [Caballeronia sordidicola]|uniref:Uncharacterized protein n=1 Tax=Caballeronia sordidicola TaxID=196367 RepID=A0A242N5M0_CABSO|nr:hypothetical protein PAMC26577_02795 [Caballeronia sordidicola]
MFYPVFVADLRNPPVETSAGFLFAGALGGLLFGLSRGV